MRGSPRKLRSSWPRKVAWLARISHHGSGRAGLQPRRYKAFLIIPLSRAPRSPAPAGLRGARDQQRAGAAISAGLKPRPSGSPLRASKRGEKPCLVVVLQSQVSDQLFTSQVAESVLELHKLNEDVVLGVNAGRAHGALEVEG